VKDVKDNTDKEENKHAAETRIFVRTQQDPSEPPEGAGVS